MPPKPPKSERAVLEAPTNEIFPTPALDSQSLRLSYAIARGEQGVLTFEPYKSILLPHWRFRTVPIARESSQTLWGAFEYYLAKGDFVGADMARKFIQMGMTRAKRYANHAGGRKYDRTAREVEEEGGNRTELPKSKGHKGQEEKLAASEIFKEVWRRCTSHEDYLRLKGEWQKEKKEWERGAKGVKGEEKAGVKREKGDEEENIVKSEHEVDMTIKTESDDGG